jgi:hypothetical protein
MNQIMPADLDQPAHLDRPGRLGSRLGSGWGRLGSAEGLNLNPFTPHEGTGARKLVAIVSNWSPGPACHEICGPLLTPLYLKFIMPDRPGPTV